MSCRSRGLGDPTAAQAFRMVPMPRLTLRRDAIEQLMSEGLLFSTIDDLVSLGLAQRRHLAHIAQHIKAV